MKNAMTLNELYRQCKILTDVDKLAGDMDDKEIIEILRFERDQAIEQLKSYGVELYEEADVVKVVRCKDCKKYKYINDVGTEEWYCDNFHGLNEPKPDDFCSYGEREE